MTLRISQGEGCPQARTIEFVFLFVLVLSFTQNMKLPTKTIKKVIKFVTYIAKVAWINIVITVQTPRVNVLTVKAPENKLFIRPCNVGPAPIG